MNIKKTLTIIISFICMIFCSLNIFAKVTAHLSQKSVGAQEEFSITYTYQGKDKQFTPDFSPLEKDFTILGVARSSQISVINGQVYSQLQWTATLSAAKPGLYAIPAVKFGDESSHEIHIKVRKQNQMTTDGANKGIFMKTEVESTSPYVQQQFIYRVKLYYNKLLISGGFDLPQVQGASIQPIGDDRKYRATVNGKPYNVVEMEYLVSADKPGQLSIKAPLFKGTVRRNNLNDINQIMMDLHKKVVITTQDTSVIIKPIPKNYTGGTWLPATNVTLSERWQDLMKKPTSGQPMTRTITISATGLLASQLPELTFDSVPGAKVYAQPSQQSDQAVDGKVMSRKTFKVVYIPTGSQDITLPAIKILWWSLQTDSEKVAKLNKKSFAIYGKKVENQKSTNVPVSMLTKQTSTNKPIQQEQKEKNTKQIVSPKPSLLEDPKQLVPWSLVAILSCIIMFLLARQKKHKPQDNSSTPTKTYVVQASAIQLNKKLLKNACHTNDPQSAKKALISWAKAQWPNIPSRQLAELKTLIGSAAFDAEIEKLQSALYSSQSQWQGKGLWQAFLDAELITKKNLSEKSKHSDFPEFNFER